MVDIAKHCESRFDEVDSLTDGLKQAESELDAALDLEFVKWGGKFQEWRRSQDRAHEGDSGQSLLLTQSPVERCPH